MRRENRLKKLTKGLNVILRVIGVDELLELNMNNIRINVFIVADGIWLGNDIED